MHCAISERIEIGDDSDVTDATLTPAYEAISAWHPGLGCPSPRIPGMRPKTRRGPIRGPN